ncbi:MAG: DUF2505 domain-containing protein [Sporichthyaceae bacterium]
MTFDAPATAVYAMLTDKVFQHHRAQKGRPVSAESDVIPAEGDGATITVQRRLAIDPPAFIKKFTGDTIAITEVQQWRDGAGSLLVRDGDLTITIANQPGDVVGVLRMDEAGEATTVTIDAEIKVRVPLLGGKVESYIGEILDKLLARDAELGSAWLAGERP